MTAAAAASEQFWRANARPLFSARPAAVRALQAEQHRASRVTPCRVYPALFFLSFFPPSSSFLSLSLSSKVNFCRWNFWELETDEPKWLHLAQLSKLLFNILIIGRSYIVFFDLPMTSWHAINVARFVQNWGNPCSQTNKSLQCCFDQLLDFLRHYFTTVTSHQKSLVNLLNCIRMQLIV